MKNRRSRDEIVNRALDLIDSASLDQKDRPGGNLDQNAMTISWLQEGLDHFHKRYPFGGQVVSASWSVAANANTTAVPSNYLLDYRDGISITTANSKRRLRRVSLDKILDISVNSQAGCPEVYCIIGDTIRYERTANVTYDGTFTYYSLPTEIDANDIPSFPDDYCLIEFVRLRGKEWQEVVAPGAALEYSEKVIATLRQSGLGQEAEINEFTFDKTIYRPQGSGNGAFDWMGSTIPS